MAAWILWDCLNKPEAEQFNSEYIFALSVHLYEGLIRRMASICGECSCDSRVVDYIYKPYITTTSFGLNGVRFLQIIATARLIFFEKDSSSMSLPMNLIE